MTNTPPPLWNKYIERTESCWVWTGAYGGAGLYGTFTEYLAPNNTTRQYVAHRLVFVYYKGPIPFGYPLHHTCSNVRCVNPEHLVPMSPQQHKRRHMARVTQCKHGHPFDEINTYTNTRGQRECRRQATLRSYYRRRNLTA